MCSHHTPLLHQTTTWRFRVFYLLQQLCSVVDRAVESIALMHLPFYLKYRPPTPTPAPTPVWKRRPTMINSLTTPPPPPPLLLRWIARFLLDQLQLVRVSHPQIQPTVAMVRPAFPTPSTGTYWPRPNRCALLLPLVPQHTTLHLELMGILFSLEDVPTATLPPLHSGETDPVAQR